MARHDNYFARHVSLGVQWRLDYVVVQRELCHFVKLMSSEAMVRRCLALYIITTIFYLAMVQSQIVSNFNIIHKECARLQYVDNTTHTSYIFLT